MRVSFDLDDVLFVPPEKYETEPMPPFPYKRMFSERLRKGTVKLIHTLQERGFEVWIYTSSYRSEAYLRTLFRGYGIRFDGIINAQRHLKEVQRNRRERLPQKLPNYYRISLHIDDEKVVRENAVRYGYRVLRVYEPDEKWAEKVLSEAERIRRLERAEYRT
ncbi:MAG: HAD family hydrolase [Clostridia bacterium]|nr:HAD family hydrolase [Oscillospiraceae bacterium]MBO5570144.1 HAD family hydrolase [Clostridia bacterium]